MYGSYMDIKTTLKILGESMAYLEHYQTSKVESFGKQINGF